MKNFSLFFPAVIAYAVLDNENVLVNKNGEHLCLLMIKSHLDSLMREEGLSVRDLAKKTKAALQTIQNAKGPAIVGCRLGTLERIADALGVSVCDLFTHISDKEVK